MKYLDIDPETREMHDELVRLSQMTDSAMTKQLLSNFAKGLATAEYDWYEGPFLVPIAIEEPDITFVGPKGSGIGDLPCKKIDDAPTSLWQTDNFMYRWNFMVHGLLAVRFWGTPPPIELRLDTQALGFVVEKTDG